MPTNKKTRITTILFANIIGYTALLLVMLIGISPTDAQTNLLTNQNYHIEPFQLPDGPSGNSINCIVQGPNGFLWFGGHTGLYRYDGYHIKSYKNDPTDSTSIAFAYIEWLFWSSDEYLWIGTYGGGLFRFDPDDESFLSFKYDPNDSTSLSNDRVTAIVEESKDMLWIGTTDGLNRLDRKTGKFERFYAKENDPTSLSYNDIRALHIDRQGTLWVGTGFIFTGNGLGGLNQFHPATKTFTQYLHDPNDPNSLAGDVIKAIYEDSRGNFWVGGEGGLHLMNRAEGTFQRLVDNPALEGDVFAPGFQAGEAGNMVHALLEDHAHNLWIFSYHASTSLSSIAQLDLETNQMSTIRERIDLIPWQATQCADGSIWTAGAGVGGKVHKLRPGNAQVKYIPFMEYVNPIEGIYFEGLLEGDDGLLWGKSTHPNRESPQFHSIDINTFEGQGTRQTPNFDIKQKQKEVITHFEWGVGAVRTGETIWGCTGDNASGLMRFHMIGPESRQYLHDPNNIHSPTSNAIYQIIADKQGFIWLATENGVSKLNPNAVTYTHFQYDPNNIHSIGEGYKFFLFEDRDGFIWVGGLNEAGPTLDRIDPKTGQTDRAFIGASFVQGAIISITQSQQGDIYFIMRGRGLYVLEKTIIDNGTWKEVFLAKQINNESFDQASNVIADNETSLWITVDGQGKVFSLNTHTHTITEFYEQQNIKFKERHAFKMADGTIYFSYQEGLVAIDPLADKSQTAQANLVRFSELQLNGESINHKNQQILEEPIWNTARLNLAYDQGTFGLRFSTFDFINPKNNQYEVRLLPEEKNWRRINGEPIVNYYNLSPGNYELEVKGSDSNGIWSKDIAKMQINIAPPWWKSWWAYGFYGLTLFSILYYLRRTELQKQEQKLQFEKDQRAKEKAVNEQLRKINAATQKFVPNAFLRSLGKDNITDVVLGDHAEQRVTVSFTDIRNYTTLSEQMTPEENFQFVSAFNSRMSPAIHKHEGFINQYLGDAIMAIFPKQPADALAAAIEMQHLLTDYNQSRQAKGKSLLRMGIGLHSGSLVMGIIGDDQRMDAATISDTVNVAARIESLTKHFGVHILLSEDTFQQLAQPNDFNCRYLVKVKVKGKHQAIGLYECFDGDTETQQALKKQTLTTFEKGLAQYFAKDFGAAMAAFESVLALNPKDKPVQLFLEKAAYFSANKVEKEWTGVEKMEWK